MPETDLNSLTIFRESAKYLISQLEESAVDFPAFERRYRPCELNRCRATCCHDGVHLAEDDAKIVEQIAERERSRFFDWGVELPEKCIEKSSKGRWKTKAREASEDELAEDYPAHFPKTKCVFLDSAHRCVLQRLSNEEKKHPWFYKPITCWMHPLTLQSPKTRGERPLLTLFSRNNDPQKTELYPGFASCTHCGRADDEGEVGEDVFRIELEMLECLSGRRLV